MYTYKVTFFCEDLNYDCFTDVTCTFSLKAKIDPEEIEWRAKHVLIRNGCKPIRLLYYSVIKN